MTNTTRDLLISLSSHMAYMQGQLEARHELDDPEDFYWYRESVLLRQKVTDALADEPAAVTGQPSDEELALVYDDCCGGCEFMDQGGFEDAAGVVLARWGNRQGLLDSSPPADGEVADVVRWLRSRAGIPASSDFPAVAAYLTRAAELLQRQALVPVSVKERPWEREGWCDGSDRCWWGRSESDDWSADWTLATPEAVAEFCEFSPRTVCLPAHALPIPQQQETNDEK